MWSSMYINVPLVVFRLLLIVWYCFHDFPESADVSTVQRTYFSFINDHSSFLGGLLCMSTWQIEMISSSVRLFDLN